MFGRKKFCDEFGYSLDDIDWGNFATGESMYDANWKFFVSFINKSTQHSVVLELSKFLTKQESNHPRRVKKEILQLISGKDIVTGLEILAERFPEGAQYIINKVPAELKDKVTINENATTL